MIHTGNVTINGVNTANCKHRALALISEFSPFTGYPQFLARNLLAFFQQHAYRLSEAVINGCVEVKRK